MMSLFNWIVVLINRSSFSCCTVIHYKITLKPKLTCLSHSHACNIPSALLPSLHHLHLDFPRSDSRVCRGGFPSNCDGEVCFLQLVFCEEELAVRYLWHRCLHQLYDHHVSQRGGCLDKHHLARLHVLSNQCFMKHLLWTLFQETSHPQPDRRFVFCAEIPVCLSFFYDDMNLFPIDAYECYHLVQVYEKVAYLLTNLGECCPHAACIYAFIIVSQMLGKHIFSPSSTPYNPSFSLLRAPTDGVWVGEQLFSEDVPVPVCKFKQLHILHRFLSREVGRLPWTLQFMFTVNLMSKDVSFQTPMPWRLPRLLLFPCSLYIYSQTSCFSIYKNCHH